MDLIILFTFAVALLIIFISLLLVRNKKASKEVEQHEEGNEGIGRRARIARNQRNRLRPIANATRVAEHVNVGNGNNDEDDDGDNDDNHNNADYRSHSQDVKIGTKKRAKLEAKEQKRIMREHETKMRAEKSAQHAKLELERKKEEEKEAEAEKKQIEMERLQREERERKELEEYLKLKATFSIEEEGYGEDNDMEKENMLATFVQYVKDNKVVVLEDLACEFKLKTQQAIDRIKELQANGTLTGVIDDRGKFIYISPEELKAVAKFIKQRGRISIADLAENSDNLITLTAASST